MGGVYAIIVAGGTGRRMGSAVPKQFLPLSGRPILDWTLSAFVRSDRVDGIVLVLPAGTDEDESAPYRDLRKVVAVVEGGEERQDSVYEGLVAVPASAEIVLVHDAVRPFVSDGLIARCVDLAREQGAAVPVTPVRDTVKAWDKAEKNLVTYDRTTLFRAQTPQAFRAPVLRDAYAKAAAEGWKGTDDASFVERAGHPVVPVPGAEENIKITLPEDLRMAEGLAHREPDFRIGLGGDGHELVEGRPLWLGGVRIEHPRGLLGHSDGDVLLHAIADAIYGAIGDRDIGFHFPPGREETKGIESRRIVAHARGRMLERGFGLVGLDAVIVCEEPKIGPLRDRIRRELAEILGMPENRVNLKGKTKEGMGLEERGAGIAAWAVVLLRGDRIPDADKGE